MTVTNPGDAGGVHPVQRMRGRIDAWLDVTMTRRRFLPAYVILVVAISGAFFMLGSTRSEIDRAELARQAAVEVERCVASVARSEGLRYNLNEIYDVLDYLYDQIDATFTPQNPDVFAETMIRLRERNKAGRAAIDQLYPQRSVERCVELANSTSD